MKDKNQELKESYGGYDEKLGRAKLTSPKSVAVPPEVPESLKDITQLCVRWNQGAFIYGHAYKISLMADHVCRVVQGLHPRCESILKNIAHALFIGFIDGFQTAVFRVGKDREWKFNIEWMMNGTDPVTGRPVYEFITITPLEDATDGIHE